MMRHWWAALPLALLLCLLGACASDAEGQKNEVQPEDLLRAEQLLADKDLAATERDLSKVANDLQRLHDTFWREVVELDGQPIGTHDPTYVIAYDNGVTETLLSTEDGSGPTNVIIQAGDLTDTWVYRSSGQIVFNGQSIRTHCRDTKANAAVRLRTIPAASLNQSPESHEDLMTDPAAVGAALAENKDLAGRCLAETTDSPSYMLFQYDSEDAVAYVIDTYSAPYIYGDHFVWGILEER